MGGRARIGTALNTKGKKGPNPTRGCLGVGLGFWTALHKEAMSGNGRGGAFIPLVLGTLNCVFNGSKQVSEG
jgi:hypothetical protein